MSKTIEQLEDLFASTDWTKDQGLEAPKEKLTDGERRYVSLHMAVIASFAQLVREGMLPAAQNSHFMMHLQDFLARLYAGESLDLGNADLTGAFKQEGGQSQTFKVDSQLGVMFKEVGNYALEHGKIDHPEGRVQVMTSDDFAKMINEAAGEATEAHEEGPSFNEEYTQSGQYQNLGKKSLN